MRVCSFIDYYLQAEKIACSCLVLCFCPGDVDSAKRPCLPGRPALIPLQLQYFRTLRQCLKYGLDFITDLYLFTRLSTVMAVTPDLWLICYSYISWITLVSLGEAVILSTAENAGQTIHNDISPISPTMLRCLLWCLLTALPGCSAGSSLAPCLDGRLELMSLCIYRRIKSGRQE